MRARGESRNAVCAANDFPLVWVGAHVRKVNPCVPLRTDRALWERARRQPGFSYGNSSLRPTEVLSPKTGSSLGRADGGWGFDVYTATPGIPGDSGSGFLDDGGRAVGTLSTVAIRRWPAPTGWETSRVGSTSHRPTPGSPARVWSRAPKRSDR